MDAPSTATTPIGNGIRTGKDYLDGLKDGREVWIHGRRVEDVTTEPGICRATHTLARFMDRQHAPEWQDTVTYVDPAGRRCATSYLLPKSAEDVRARGRAFYEWAKWSHGMFGRTPDYKNASVMAFAGALGFLTREGGQTDFAANMARFYEHIRTNDKVLTHTLVNPAVNHAQAAKGVFSSDVALHVTRETDAGIVVKGARLLATLGPSADEIEVFPSTVLKASEENLDFAFAFAIPVDTPGMKMICRDTYDHGKSSFDAPLASRFEEMDAVVIFNDVLVPWERVFMYRDPAQCNQAFGATNAVVHMAHQVACGKLAKAEFLTGILCAILKATGRDRDMALKGIVTEAMLMTETVRALLFQAEAEAHEDQWGNFIPARRPLDTSRNIFPTFYPRLIEIIQNMGASSLMAIPTEADFAGELAEDIEQYFQVANLGARDRVALFRLAHDVAVSGFGNRQVLYERFFFGPPHLMRAAYFDLYDRDRLIERVEGFLAEG